MTPANGHNPPIIAEYRCRHCGRRLFDAYLPPGTKLRIRCCRCAAMNAFGFEKVIIPVEKAEPEPVNIPIKAESILQLT